MYIFSLCSIAHNGPRDYFLINVSVKSKNGPEYRHVGRFQDQNFTFATFYLKISAMEGETFCVFFVSIVLPTMDLETILR